MQKFTAIFTNNTKCLPHINAFLPTIGYIEDYTVPNQYEEYIQLDVWELPQYPAQRKFMFNSSDGVKFMVEEREIYVKLVEEPLV